MKKSTLKIANFQDFDIFCYVIRVGKFSHCALWQCRAIECGHSVAYIHSSVVHVCFSSGPVRQMALALTFPNEEANFP